VRRRRLHAAVAAAAWIVSFESPLVGQTAGTVDIGASVVEYDGFLVSGAAVVSPALRFDAENLSLGAQGSWTLFESGNQIVQATVAGAWLTPPRGGWRVEFSGSAGAAKYADERGYGHVLARTRLHMSGERAGGWVGATTGGSFGDSSQVPFELAVGGWTVQDRLTLVGTLSATWLGTDGHVDLLGAARWAGERVEVEGRAGMRPWAESGDGVGEARVGAWADLSALVSLTDRIKLALSGGAYPSDPVRQVLGATYVTVGLRFDIFRRQVSPVPTITGAMARAARERAVTESSSRARLEIGPWGDPRALLVHVAGARSVELMGDFTDWQPLGLAQTGPDTWEIRVSLTPGAHRVNIRVDGGRWLAPRGTRLEQTEFGGPVGVVVIP
jgi:hypothetical protein